MSGKETVAFIGLGLMGHGMAKNIVEKGYPLTVVAHRNRKPIEDLVGRGAVEVATAREAAERASIVFLCVTGSREVEAVIRGNDGLKEGLKPGSVIVDLAADSGGNCELSQPGETVDADGVKVEESIDRAFVPDIAVADEGYKSLGLSGYRLEFTSLGDETCRPQYREALQEFLFGLDLDEPTRERARINPLRVLDDKRPEIKEMTASAPLMLDHLSDSAREHFDEVRRGLDRLGVEYVINPRLVRGLDYYTKTTFEFVHDGLGAQSGIGGGGRYDGLMKQVGGKQDLSGIGFGIGVDRTVLALEAEGVSVAGEGRVQVYGVPLGAAAKSELVYVAGQLRAAGVSVDLAYGDRGLKGAMKAADRSGARLALVLGDRELEERTIEVKDLSNGEQRKISLDDVVATARALLAE